VVHRTPQAPSLAALASASVHGSPDDSRHGAPAGGGGSPGGRLRPAGARTGGMDPSGAAAGVGQGTWSPTAPTSGSPQLSPGGTARGLRPAASFRSTASGGTGGYADPAVMARWAAQEAAAEQAARESQAAAEDATVRGLADELAAIQGAITAAQGARGDADAAAAGYRARAAALEERVAAAEQARGHIQVWTHRGQAGPGGGGGGGWAGLVCRFPPACGLLGRRVPWWRWRCRSQTPSARWPTSLARCRRCGR
jgi:hypothetical protein